MVNLKSFLQKPRVFFIAGAPRSGKTHLTHYIIQLAAPRVDNIFVFSSSAFTGSYDFLPEDSVTDEYTEDKLRAIMKFQKSAGPALLVIDDCVGSIHFSSGLLRNLITTHRHYKLTIIICTQFVNRIDTTIRECSEYAVIFKQRTKRAIEAAYESFLSRKFPNEMEASRDMEKRMKGEKHRAIFVFMDSGEIQTIKAPKKLNLPNWA